MKALPLFHRIAGERVVVVGEGPPAEARRRLVARAGGLPCPETEAHRARLAFVAIGDMRDAAVAALRLKRRGLLVNVADRPELCDFVVPSVLDRDPVLVAVGTGGASAGLAKHLRLRLEALLPPSLGRLADALFASRGALRSRFPSADDRRRALDEALAEGGALDPLGSASAEAVPGWLAGAKTPPHRCEEIVLRSDDPDDLTLRQARLLGSTDQVLHDADVPEAILARARADAVRRVLPCPVSPAGATVILRRDYAANASAETPTSAK